MIITGTPAGVAEGRTPQPWLQPGDAMLVEIEKIGQLANTVIADPSTESCFHVMAKL